MPLQHSWPNITPAAGTATAFIDMVPVQQHSPFRVDANHLHQPRVSFAHPCHWRRLPASLPFSPPPVPTLPSSHTKLSVSVLTACTSHGTALPALVRLDFHSHLGTRGRRERAVVHTGTVARRMGIAHGECNVAISKPQPTVLGDVVGRQGPAAGNLAPKRPDILSSCPFVAHSRGIAQEGG